MEMKLNAGCGNDIRDGWINIDNYRNLPENVYKVDLEKHLPFGDNTFDYILASHCLEHTLRYADIIVEFHRILKPNGILEIKTPIGLNPNPWHIRFLWKHSLDFFFIPNPESLDLNCPKEKMFTLLNFKIERSMWFRYHLKKYLHINITKIWTFPIGQKYGMFWILRKV